MGEMMSDLQWVRARRFLDAEIDRWESEDTDRPDLDEYQKGFRGGMWYALMKIKGRYFLTEAERHEVAEAGREMFG